MKSYSYVPEVSNLCATANDADMEHKDWMHTNNRVREFERAAGWPMRSEVRFPVVFELGQGEALAPWTSVNNCTRTEYDPALTAQEIAVAESDYRRVNESVWKKPHEQSKSCPR